MNKYLKIGGGTILATFAIVPTLIATSCSTTTSEQQYAYTIFHTNDVHGRLEPSTAKYNSWMGLEKIATYTKMNNHDLMIDAGDLIQGLAINTLDNGKTAQNLANYIGYDIRGIGNHEFDWGINNLITLAMSSNAPMLSNNIVFNKDYTYNGTDIDITFKKGHQLFPSYKIETLHDGTKVGIIGVSTPETVDKTNPKNVEMLEFQDPIVKTKESVKELQDLGINLIFAVSHLGVAETSTYTSERLAQEVDGLDLIIDGHSHTKLESGIEVKKPNQPNSTWIAQTGSYSINLGEIDFNLSDDKTALKDVNVHLLGYDSNEIKNIQADAEAVKITQPLKDQWNENSKKVSFTLPEGIDLMANSGEGENMIEETRVRETNMGDMYSDALVYDYNEQKKSENKQADFSIINGGSFRANITSGPVTNGQVSDTSPFGNTLQAVDLTAKEVIDLFTTSVEKNYGQGGFLQVSNGVVVSYDKVNKKLISLTINGTKLVENSTQSTIDETKTFKVVINDYLGSGGDNYGFLKDKKKEEVTGTIDESFGKYGKYLESKNTTTTKADMTTMTFENYKEQFPTNRISFIDSNTKK